MRKLGLLGVLLVAGCQGSVAGALDAPGSPIVGATAVRTEGTLYDPDPVANSDDMDSYPHAIQLARAGAANGTILVTFERQVRTSTKPGRGWLFYESHDGGKTFARLGGPLEPAHLTDATNALQPNLLELAHDAPGAPAGTILFAGVTGSGTKLEIQVYRSDDHGATFMFWSTLDATDTVISPRRSWEPFLVQLDDGRVVAYFSDELVPGGRQNIARKISTDGGTTWGAKASAWESTDPGDRPGMATVARMGDGDYVMSVEMCGAPGDFCRAHIKTSSDGLTWGTGPSDMGTRVLSATGHPFHGNAFIAWRKEGGPKGTLVLSAQDLMKSVGEPNTIAGGHGQTLLVNSNGGAGPWDELTAPIAWTAGTPRTQAGYRNAVLPLPGTSDLLYFISTYSGQGVRNRMLYAIANGGVLPYEAPFAAPTAVGWQTFGGAWSVAGAAYTNADGAPGDKAVAGSTAWRDVTMAGDLRLDGKGNAGFLVRLTDPQTGVDAQNGYFAGLSSVDGTAFIGREQGNWTLLGSAHSIPGGVPVGAWINLSVVATGCSFTVSVRTSPAPATTFAETDPGCVLRNGQIGLRSFETSASWRGITVR